MRNLLSILLLAAVVVATGCNSSKATAQTAAPQTRAAAQQGPPQGGPDLKAMAERLNLTDQQTVDFKAVKEKYAAQFQELRKSSGGYRETMRTKMQNLQANEKKEIDAMLNAEQQAEYAKILKEQEANRPQRGGRPGGQGGGRPGGGTR